jgi:hypothetical protein
LNNVRFEVEAPDLRPAIVLDHVSDGAFTELSAMRNPQAMAAISERRRFR